MGCIQWYEYIRPKRHTHTHTARRGWKFDHLSVDTELPSCVTSGVFTNIAIGRGARHVLINNSPVWKSHLQGVATFVWSLKPKTSKTESLFTSISCFILFSSLKYSRPLTWVTICQSPVDHSIPHSFPYFPSNDRPHVTCCGVTSPQ